MEQEKRAIQTWRKRNIDELEFCGVSDLVWAGISYDGSTDLYVIRNGSLTGVRYMNEIIAPIVRP